MRRRRHLRRRRPRRWPWQPACHAAAIRARDGRCQGQGPRRRGGGIAAAGRRKPDDSAHWMAGVFSAGISIHTQPSLCSAARATVSASRARAQPRRRRSGATVRARTRALVARRSIAMKPAGSMLSRLTRPIPTPATRSWRGALSPIAARPRAERRIERADIRLVDIPQGAEQLACASGHDLDAAAVLHSGWMVIDLETPSPASRASGTILMGVQGARYDILPHPDEQ